MTTIQHHFLSGRHHRGFVDPEIEAVVW